MGATEPWASSKTTNPRSARKLWEFGGGGRRSSTSARPWHGRFASETSTPREIQMSLNIKNKETCRLAADLADLTGETMTGAITVALRERLEREVSRRSAEARARRLLAIGRRCASMLDYGRVRRRARQPPVRRARAPAVIVDTPAVPAVLLQEPDAARCAGSIAAAPSRRMSVRDVAWRRRSSSRAAAARWPDTSSMPSYGEAGIGLEPATPVHARAARRAWSRFGRGDQPAGLNLGDCFAHALASAAREPLLFKGGDFVLTDIDVASPPGGVPGRPARSGAGGRRPGPASPEILLAAGTT